LLVSSVAQCRAVPGSHETAEPDWSPLLVVGHWLHHVGSALGLKSEAPVIVILLHPFESSREATPCRWPSRFSGCTADFSCPGPRVIVCWTPQPVTGICWSPRWRPLK